FGQFLPHEFVFGTVPGVVLGGALGAVLLFGLVVLNLLRGRTDRHCPQLTVVVPAHPRSECGHRTPRIVVGGLVRCGTHLYSTFGTHRTKFARAQFRRHRPAHESDPEQGRQGQCDQAEQRKAILHDQSHGLSLPLGTTVGALLRSTGGTPPPGFAPCSPSASSSIHRDGPGAGRRWCIGVGPVGGFSVSPSDPFGPLLLAVPVRCCLTVFMHLS